MKKICHITSAHPPEDGRIFRRACVSAAKAGYDTYLVEQGDTYDKQDVHIVGIGVPSKTGRLHRMTQFSKRAYNTAVKLDADLYHLHDPELLRYALKFKKSGKAVVFDSHENYVEQIRNKPYLPKPLAIILSKWFNVYSKGIYSKIDGLTYPGSDEYISVFDGLCKHVVTTDNLPWLSELYDLYDDSIEREEKSTCYIGGLEESRGITQMIKAAYGADCKLYLAGRFSSSDYHDCLKQMKEYECVQYLGVIGRKEVAELLQRVSLGLCTLLNVGQYYKMHNLPTKVYEYMSMAVPVLLNDSEYNKKAAKEMEFGECVDPMDIDEFSEKIIKIISDKKKRAQYGINGRNEIKNKYCWDKEQEKLIRMYKDILSE